MITSGEACDTLLVTSAIRPGLGQLKLAISEPLERLRQTICSLVAWAEEPGIRQIVICDGSGSGDQLESVRLYLEPRGKTLEVLSFLLPTDEVAERGKGFGEGLIIAHALANSELLRAAPSFYKVTGRLYIENFSSIQCPANARFPTFPWEVSPARTALLGLVYRWFGSPRRIRRLAQRSWPRLLPGTATWFWHCPRAYYQEHLQDCFRAVCDPERVFLEHAMFVPLAVHGVRCFSPWPVVVGQSGTNGRLYAGRDYPPWVLESAAALLGLADFDTRLCR